MCSEVVETRRKSASNFDTTKLLNELLANDKWLEQVIIALHVDRGLSGPSSCSWLLHFFKPFLSSSPSDQVTFGPSNSWCVFCEYLRISYFHPFQFLQQFRKMQDIWADADTFIRWCHGVVAKWRMMDFVLACPSLSLRRRRWWWWCRWWREIQTNTPLEIITTKKVQEKRPGQKSTEDRRD